MTYQLTPGRTGLRVLRPNSPAQWAGLALIAGWVLLAVLAPLISADPLAQDTANRLRPPSLGHLFGTDQLGRDVLSRVLHGARATLPIGCLIVILATAVGVPAGALAGFVRGWLDEAVMRLADLLFALPALVLALAIAAALGPSVRSAIIAIAAVMWPRYARVARGQVLTLRQREFVLADQATGASSSRVLWQTVLPNAAPVVTLVAVLDLGTATLAGATLSFLGLGLQPPAPEWGAMVSSGVLMPEAWWTSLFPGLALVSFVIAVNLYGQVLQEVRKAATA
jgi:peptide/nickel transport system permease protein